MAKYTKKATKEFLYSKNVNKVVNAPYTGESKWKVSKAMKKYREEHPEED